MPVNSAGMLMPRPAAMAALSTPARTIAPRRLRSRNSQSSSAIAKPNADQEQPVRREHARADMHRARQNFRRRQAEHQPPPERLHQIEEDEREAERQQHLVHVAAAIERPHEHAAPSRRRSKTTGIGARMQRQPEAAGELEDRQAEERAQHEERAVREAHDVHQPEDQREARRHEEQQHAVHQPVQKLGDQKLHATLSADRSGHCEPDDQ